MTHPSKPQTPQEVAQAMADLSAQSGARGTAQRIDCSSENLEQGLARLVLAIVELLRKVMERQAIRRMEGGSLTPQQVEEMGQALMKLEAKVGELAEQFGLRPEDLNLDLGPLGNLLDE